MQSNSPASPVVNCNPATLLPHRNPFLFIDCITSRETGVSAAGVLCVTSGKSAIPHVLLIESMAQVGGIAVAQKEGEGGFLASIEYAQVARPVQAGDCLQISVKVVKSFGRLFLLSGEITVAGEEIAQARFTLGIGSV